MDLNIILILNFLIVYLLYNYLIIKQKIPPIVVKIYKDPIFKIIFLFTLYAYGNLNIPLSIFLGLNYIGLGQIIQEKELMFNL
jgi:hypothetical protein